MTKTSTATAPHTINSELKRRAERRVRILSEIGDLQEDLKVLKADDKAGGYNERALAQCVKEMLRGHEYQEEQLQLELELDTYRTACGLPVTLETAQRKVAETARSVNYSTKIEKVTTAIDEAFAVPFKQDEKSTADAKPAKSGRGRKKAQPQPEAVS